MHRSIWSPANFNLWFGLRGWGPVSILRTFSKQGGASLRTWAWFQHLEKLGGGPVQANLGGASLETFSGEGQLKKSPCNFCFRAWVIFQGSPLFLALLGHSHVRGISTLNFGPISTKLGGTVRAIKKMTQKDNGPSPGRNYGETDVFTLGQKVVFGLKIGYNPKNQPKWYFGW